MIPCLHVLKLSITQLAGFKDVSNQFSWFDPINNVLKARYLFGEELLTDLYWLFLSDSVKILPMQQISASARLNYLVFYNLIKNPAIQGLRIRTRESREKAFFAALELLNIVVSALPEEFNKIVNELAILCKTVDRLRRQRAVVEQALTVALHAGIGVEIWEEYLKGISESCQHNENLSRRLLAELMRLWYSGNASHVAHSINGSYAEEGAFQKSGNEKSKEVKSSMRLFLEKASRYSGNPKLQAIANRALTIQTVGVSGSVPFSGTETLKGVCTGDIIEYILSEQWFGFLTPKYKKKFYSQLIEQQLWMLDLDYPCHKGELVICLDCSGSMQGRNEELAKAAALSLLETARSGRRDCRIILFADRDTVKTVTCPGGAFTEEDILEIVHTFYYTKHTDYSGVLKECFKLADSANGSRDLLVITDGHGVVSEEVVRMVDHLERVGCLHTWAIIVGEGSGDKVVKGFARQVYYSQELLG